MEEPLSVLTVRKWAQEAVGDMEMEILFVLNNQLTEAEIEHKPLVTTHQMMLPLITVINFFQ